MDDSRPILPVVTEVKRALRTLIFFMFIVTKFPPYSAMDQSFPVSSFLLVISSPVAFDSSCQIQLQVFIGFLYPIFAKLNSISTLLDYLSLFQPLLHFLFISVQSGAPCSFVQASFHLCLYPACWDGPLLSLKEASTSFPGLLSIGLYPMI